MDALNSGKLQEDKCSRRSRKEQGERSLDFQVNQERPRWEGGSGVRGEGSGNVSYIDTQERDLQVMGSASGKTLRWVYAWVVCEQEEVCVGVSSEWGKSRGKGGHGTVIWRKGCGCAGRAWHGGLLQGLWLLPVKHVSLGALSGRWHGLSSLSKVILFAKHDNPVVGQVPRNMDIS